MRNHTAICFVFALALFSLGVFGTSFAGDPDFDELAKRIVTTSAGVEPGDVVVVNGGTHTIPLMEAVAVEVMKAGGMANMFLDSDRVQRAFFMDVDEKFLGQEPRYFAAWLKTIDVWIGLPGTEDPRAVFADIPEDRFAKAAKAGQVVGEMLNESGVRVVIVGYPTEEQAAISKVDFGTYEKMHWNAVNADYARISEHGRKLREMLQGAKEVRITSPSGTDLTFSVGDRPVFADDGIVTKEEAGSDMILTRFASLPGGSVFLAPIESSANGKVVVPRHLCRFEPMTSASFEFKAGELQGFSAKQGGECYEQTMEPYGGAKEMFAAVSIGLNPELRVKDEGADYRPDGAAGMVWINIGDNELLGGNNKTDAAFGFPLVGATVEIDGKTVVRDGQLAM